MPGTRGLRPSRRSARRGGHRPGAGAPFGNVNAIVSGEHSARYADASLLLHVIPVAWRLTLFEQAKVLMRWSPEHPERFQSIDPRAALPRILEAARQVIEAIIEAIPQQPGEIEEHVIEALYADDSRLPQHLQDQLLRYIDSPTPQRQRWQKALAIAALMNKFNPELGEALIYPLFDLLRAFILSSSKGALPEHAEREGNAMQTQKNSIKQSNPPATSHELRASSQTSARG